MTTIRLALALTLAPACALAQDYPFSGIFALYSAAPWTCAYEFFITAPDGSYRAYALDRGKYLADGTIAYVKVSAGRCTAESPTTARVFEDCTFESSVIDPPPGGHFYDQVGFADPAQVVVITYADKAEQVQALAGKPTESDKAAQVLPRCTGLDAAKLEPFLVDQPQGISTDYYDHNLDSVADDPASAGFQAKAPDIFARLK